jgi:hypothetical protein
VAFAIGLFAFIAAKDLVAQGPLTSSGERTGRRCMNDLIYVLISLGLFTAFAVAIFGYERVE